MPKSRSLACWSALGVVVDGSPENAVLLSRNSVNRNVTTPEGAAAGSADTDAESHNRHAPTSYIGGSGPVAGWTCF